MPNKQLVIFTVEITIYWSAWTWGWRCGNYWPSKSAVCLTWIQCGCNIEMITLDSHYIVNTSVETMFLHLFITIIFYGLFLFLFSNWTELPLKYCSSSTATPLGEMCVCSFRWATAEERIVTRMKNSGGKHVTGRQKKVAALDECVAAGGECQRVCDRATWRGSCHSLLQGWKCSRELWNLCVSCVAIIEQLTLLCNPNSRLAGWDCRKNTLSPPAGWQRNRTAQNNPKISDSFGS